MTAEEYAALEQRTEATIADLRRALAAERGLVVIPPADELRPLEAGDVHPGVVAYHDNGDDGWFWHVVSEPRYYGDPHKAYVADDGSRYGLDGAYVRRESPEPEKA